MSNVLPSHIPVQTKPDVIAGDAWKNVCRRLRAELGEDVFTSWFARLELDGVEGDHAQLSVPTRFLRSWLQSHYNEKLMAIVASEIPQVARVSIGMRTAAKPVMLFFVKGEATVGLVNDVQEAQIGTWIHIPASLKHSIKAKTPVVMLLVLLK